MAAKGDFRLLSQILKESFSKENIFTVAPCGIALRDDLLRYVGSATRGRGGM